MQGNIKSLFDQRLGSKVDIQLPFTAEEFFAYQQAKKVSFYSLGYAATDWGDHSKFTALLTVGGARSQHVQLNFASVLAWVQEFRKLPKNIEEGATYEDWRGVPFVVEALVQPYDPAHQSVTVLLRSPSAARIAISIEAFQAINLYEGKAQPAFKKICPDL